MEVRLRFTFSETAPLYILNALAEENREIHRRQPTLPLLYESGVVYRREKRETWMDYPTILIQGHKDCDSLAAARAGELMAKGWAALWPAHKGYALAQRLKPESIDAQVFLRTRTTPDKPGLYHCLVRYQVGNQWFEDDPSARLGMYGSRIDAAVLSRWRQLGVTPRFSPLP